VRSALPFQGYHQRREAEWVGALVLLGVAIALLLPGATFSRPTFDGRPVRIVYILDEPWFVATDVAHCLGYRDAPNMLRNLDEDEHRTHNVSSPLTRQSVISEPGLFHAVNNRRLVKGLPQDVKDRVVRFQRWVNHEVLPSIRRTGSYALPTVPQPSPVQNVAAMLEVLKNPALALEVIGHYATENLSLKGQVVAAQPAVDFCDALADSNGLWGLRAAGKALHQGPDLFIKWLRERGDLYDLNGGPVAKQDLINRKLFDVAWEIHGGKPRPTTKITGKGILHYARALNVRPPQVSPQGLLPGF
jgi:prophage antirepressor-like protein/phage antirepressor YoqD-like protein